MALCMLAKHSKSNRWQEEAKQQLAYMSGAAHRHPTAHGFTLLAAAQFMY